MHFRERGQVVQLIRTTYEPGSKKGKSQIVGRLMKGNPLLSDELKKELSTEERKEVATWIEGFGGVVQLKRELAARTLQEQLSLAAEWFAENKGDDARILAAGLVPAWVRLRLALKRNGLVE
ncbi:MAG: hypothetical protein ABSH33_17630 [Steroidobacteraceae bacterium]|jgi:hypothetical protein